MKNKKIRRGFTVLDWLVAAGLGALAALVYFLQFSDFAYPGESATLLSAIQGLEDFPAVRYPLASFFCRLLSDAVAPFSGALATALLFLVSTRYLRRRIESDLTSRAIDWLSRAAGIAAALLFLLSPTVRSAATHFEPRLVDLAWALSAAGVLMAMRAVHGYAALFFPMLSGAMLGIGAADSPTFSLLLPLFLMGAWSIASKRRHVKGKFAAATLLLFFLGAMAWTVSSSFAGAENGAFGAWYAGQKAIARLWFAPKWSFTIPVFATLPFVAALFSARRSFRSTSGWMSILFHAVMSVAAIMSMVMSPNRIMAGTGYAPAFIAAFSAFTSGYLIAYWWHLAMVVGEDDGEQGEVSVRGDLPTYAKAESKPPYRGVGLTALWIFALALAGSVVAGLVGGDDGAAFADRVAERIVADMGEREVLVVDARVTGGEGLHLSSHILLAAKRAGRKIELLRVDKDNGVARVKDWFAKDPDAARKAAVYGMPDLWRYARGVEPVAEMFFFGGDPSRKTPSVEERRRFAEVLHAPEGWGSYRYNATRERLGRLDLFRLSLRRQLAFTSCMAGCAAHAKGVKDEAFAFYEFVLRELDGDNIVAVLNEMELATGGFKPAVDRREENARFLSKVASDERRRYNLSTLSLFYGYLMNVGQILRMGLGMADGNESEIGLAHIERAIGMMPEDAGERLRLSVLAPRWITGDARDREAAKAEFSKVLEREPGNYVALMGMSRIAMMEGNRDEAIAILERAVNAGGDDSRVSLDLARLLLMKEDFDKARPILLKATDLNPSDRGLWLLRAGAALAEYDALAKVGEESAGRREAILDELDRTIIATLERLGKDNPDCLFAKAEVLVRHGGKENLMKARNILEAVIGDNPKNPVFREKLMQTLAALGESEAAAKVAEAVLNDETPSPLANWIVGSVALKEGNLAKAESHLRKATSIPMALNDLADCLRRCGNHVEAEDVARKVTEIAGDRYEVWETLGSVIVDAGDASRLEEAEGYIQKSWDMTRNSREGADVRVAVSLARVKVLRGDKSGAGPLLRAASRKLDSLDEDTRKLYEKLVDEVEGRSRKG